MNINNNKIDFFLFCEEKMRREKKIVAGSRSPLHVLDALKPPFQIIVKTSNMNKQHDHNIQHHNMLLITTIIHSFHRNNATILSQQCLQ